MKKVSGIEDVIDNLSVYEYFSSLSTWVRIGSVAALIVLGFLSIMLSANTIRLTVFARKKELQIMKMCIRDSSWSEWDLAMRISNIIRVIKR